MNYGANFLIYQKDYEKQGYKFISRENIYKSVVKILNNK